MHKAGQQKVGTAHFCESCPDPSSGMSGHAASKAIVSLQSLSGVPNEILLRVLEELDYPSLVNLVATNSYFWHNCRRHMFDVQASLLGLWAGEHIVCIGGDSWEEVYYSVCSQALSEVRFPRHDQRFHHEDRAWILRNLSTQEFVRAEAIAQSPKDIHGPYIDHVGFSHVVLMLICWSSHQNPSWSIDTHGMASGPWAGHCFDITTMEEHERSIKDGEQWKDVSVEVAKDLTAMLRSQIYNHG